MNEPDRWEDPLDAPLGELPERLKRAVALLRERTPAQVGLAQLSAAAGVSKHHLSRLFLRYFGEPPHRLQQRRRLGLAAQLLRAGKRPVDVAEELNFTDQAHLAHRFKRAFGVTPAQFAKRTPEPGGPERVPPSRLRPLVALPPIALNLALCRDTTPAESELTEQTTNAVSLGNSLHEAANGARCTSAH